VISRDSRERRQRVRVFSSGLIPVYNYTVDWTSYYIMALGHISISVYCLVICMLCCIMPCCMLYSGNSYLGRVWFQVTGNRCYVRTGDTEVLLVRIYQRTGGHFFASATAS
jgi:hypothetical protein